MSATPEQVIRTYLDENGGQTEARVHHLLTSFHVAAGDEHGRRRITAALASAGVEVDRPLAGLSEDAGIRLFTPSARRRTLPPLLSQRPRPVQVLLAGVVPALYGALTGVVLGVSEPAYLVLSLLGILGAVAAGFEHRGARAGAVRGVLAGSIFGAFILIAHQIHGEDAKAHLPDPEILLLVLTTGFAMPLAALGGSLRRRQELKGPA
jgi:hypothetical protein